jgi:oligoendopeptidase F
MSTTSEQLADPELPATAWDLAPLVDGDGAEGAVRLLERASLRADAFATRYAGQIAELSSEGLREAMQELAVIEEEVRKAAAYASLRLATDTADPERGALLQRVQERAAELETKLLFWELEWAALAEERVEALLSDPALEFCAHYLRSLRRYRPHLLSEPEEKLLAEQSLSSRAAWCRLFDQLTAALAIHADGEELSLDVALSRLQDPDRELHRTTSEAITAALEPGLRTRSFIYNTLLYEKSVEDRLRRYPHWLASRNLANETSDASVTALTEAVRGRYDVPQRWYALKARLLGLDRLRDYDRWAPVVADDQRFTFGQARELVLEAFAAFSTELGVVARRFFTERWIDAPVRPHKRPGAYCSYGAPSVHPYVLLNFTGRRRDVLTMAHELGHGVHAALAQPRGAFHQASPLTLAETASVFGETLVCDRLLAAAGSDQQRLSLLAGQIDGAVATVFRQVAMNRFEHLAHTHRRSDGELSAQRLGELWLETQAELLGDSVELSAGHDMWWSYVSHFISTPGYVYAYAYGQLLALSAYRRYVEEGDAFVPSYLKLLAAGGSRSPAELSASIGIDLTDPGFWDAGLGLVEQQLAQAEALVAGLGAG